MKHIETIAKDHISAIYLVAKLIDRNAPSRKIEAARIKRDSARNLIRKSLPNYDRGYT